MQKPWVVFGVSFLSLALSLGARASELSPAELLSAVEGLYDTSFQAPMAPGSSHREEHDAHILVRRAHRLLEDGAAPEVEERLRELLSFPADAGETDGPRAPGSAGWSVLKTPHFRIHYQTSGEQDAGPDDDGDGVPDKAKWVAEAFELAYSREIDTFGYPTPPDIPQYKVVLKRLKVNALTHPEGGGRTWCEFNFAMREKGTPEQIQQKFRAVAAHEFFHSVQALLNWNEEDWWTEGSADWMSELVDPGNGFYRSNAALRQEQPEVGLAADRPFFPYAGSLVAAYLTPVAGKGEDLVKAVWLEIGNLAQSARVAGSQRRTFVRRAFERLFGSFEDVIVRFWPHVYLRDFPGGKDLPRAARYVAKNYPKSLQPGFLPQPNPLGANFIEFHPSAGHENEILHVTLKPNGKKGRLAARVVMMGPENWRSVPVKTAVDGSVEVKIHGLGSTWRAATLTVVNVGRGNTSYSLDARFVSE